MGNYGLPTTNKKPVASIVDKVLAETMGNNKSEEKMETYDVHQEVKEEVVQPVLQLGTDEGKEEKPTALYEQLLEEDEEDAVVVVGTPAPQRVQEEGEVAYRAEDNPFNNIIWEGTGISTDNLKAPNINVEGNLDEYFTYEEKEDQIDQEKQEEQEEQEDVLNLAQVYEKFENEIKQEYQDTTEQEELQEEKLEEVAEETAEEVVEEVTVETVEESNSLAFTEEEIKEEVDRINDSQIEEAYNKFIDNNEAPTHQELQSEFIDKIVKEDQDFNNALKDIDTYTSSKVQDLEDTNEAQIIKGQNSDEVAKNFQLKQIGTVKEEVAELVKHYLKGALNHYKEIVSQQKILQLLISQLKLTGARYIYVQENYDEATLPENVEYVKDITVSEQRYFVYALKEIPSNIVNRKHLVDIITTISSAIETLDPKVTPAVSVKLSNKYGIAYLTQTETESISEALNGIGIENKLSADNKILYIKIREGATVLC